MPSHSFRVICWIAKPERFLGNLRNNIPNSFTGIKNWFQGNLPKPASLLVAGDRFELSTFGLWAKKGHFLTDGPPAYVSYIYLLLSMAYTILSITLFSTLSGPFGYFRWHFGDTWKIHFCTKLNTYHFTTIFWSMTLVITSWMSGSSHFFQYVRI